MDYQLTQILPYNYNLLKMSKFFAEGNISDEDAGSGSQESQNRNRNGPSYQYDFMDDDRGNNEKRVVLTEKAKKWNLIKQITVKINAALNNEDYQKVWVLLQEMLKEIEKIAKLIEKEGYPRLFLRCLKKIKDEIAEVDGNSQAKKKMKKHAATAFSTMKQKFKKIYPVYESAINEELANGDEESDSEPQENEDESSEEQQEEDDKKLLQSPDPMVRRKYWLKKPKHKENSEDDEQKQKEKEKQKQKQKEKEKDDEKKRQQKKKVAIVTKKKTVIEIQSIKDAQNRMKDIRKNFMRLHNQEQRQDYLLTLDKISENSKKYKDFEQLSFHLLDIPIRIDVCRQMKLTHFPRAQWTRLYSTIVKINHILRESQEEDLIENIRLFDDNSSKNATGVAVKAVTEESIYLSLKTYLVLIESQLKKALIYLEANESEYYQRLQDLIGLVDVMYKISKQIQSYDEFERDAAELAFKVLENTYFMSEALITRIKQDLGSNPQFLELVDEQKLQNYANLVLKNSKDEETKIKTLLYLIYNHAINYREKGKELLVISTLSDQILSQDYYTQTLYNRALVQLGLGAFRNGNLFEVQQFLYEMCSGSRARETTKDILKEFLAQGYSRLIDAKEIPRSKILPSYLHLNVDLIESVELVASMLLELPYTLTEGGRITSKTFKKFYYQYERNYFIEESLNNRDLIYAAGLHLREGRWSQSFQKLSSLTIWTVLPDADTARSNLLRNVKEQSLKCYLIGNRKCFRSISIGGLASKFELEERVIRKLICRLISQKILQGAITREGYLVFTQKKQSEVQKICQTLANRLQQMGKANELWFSQKVNAAYDSQEQGEHDKQEKGISRKLNLAINQKLKSILSKRTQKY